nr:RNA-directed DNA polymerase, eukaryota, reverse transcriptase zinc-binding domain protein [Tanacetum cinerariifolium]
REKVILCDKIKLSKIDTELELLDWKAENDGLSQHDNEERLSPKKVKDDLDHLVRLDLIQKAKVKWAIEGDENSKYFHGIVNNNFSRIKVGSKNIDVSHLQFADDALIMAYNGEIHKRLTSWKAKTLFYGGRLTLLKSVLGTLGTYFFSLFIAPKGVINYLEKLRRNFFWGGSLDVNKLHWIEWKKVCSLTSCGGLGIGSLYASDISMVTKWWWCLFQMITHYGNK